MTARLLEKLAAAKAAIIAGDPDRATSAITDFAALARRKGIPAADRALLESRIAEMRDLAEISLRGARQAIEEVRAIVEAARSLQTYDDSGRRHSASTAAPAPHRF